MDAGIVVLQLDKVCRLCLNEGKMLPINAESAVDDKTVSFSEMLEFCTTLKVTVDDGLPSQVCVKCSEAIRQFYKFKEKCLRNDDILRCSLSVEVLKMDDDEDDGRSGCKDKRDEIGEDASARLRCDDKNEENVQDKEEACDAEKLDDTLTSGAPAISSPTTDTKYYCGKCDLYFESEETYSKHRSKLRHPRKRDHKCPLCDKRFSSTHLRIHMRSHTKDKPYGCPTCGARFSLKCNLQRHEKTHTGERPFACSYCGKGFIQMWTLKEHERTHTGERPYICGDCGRAFKQKGQLTTHAMSEHQRDRKGRLKTADAATSSSSELRKDPLQYTCTICQRSFNTKGVLRAHSLIHGEKTFLCTQCGRGFVSKAGLKSHSSVHTGVRLFACDICNKSFSQHGSMKTHMLIHTGERPFRCSFCGKTFTQRNHLTYHKRIHTGERPFMCLVCKKTFSLKGTLTVHMRCHTGETPYLCSVCGKGFKDSSSLKKHYRRHKDVLDAKDNRV